MEKNHRHNPARSPAIGVDSSYAPAWRGVTSRLLSSTLDLLLPAPCLACDAPAQSPQTTLGLCNHCRQLLEPWPAGCPRCGGLGPLEICGQCRLEPPPFSRLLNGWSYQPPLDRVLTSLKFEGLDYLGGQLGKALSERLGEALAPCDLVCPIPLHWTRRWNRGFDQALEIARTLARQRHLPLATLLRRRRPTRAQSRLGRRARQRNLRDAFVVRRPAACLGRRLLLVDDVYTTGSTLQAAAHVLLATGAESVIGVTVARTPAEGGLASSS